MRIAICEDEIDHGKNLEALIFEWGQNKNVEVKIKLFPNAQSFLDEWETDSSQFDLVLLDIQMGTISGLDLAEKIRKTDQSIIIIFVSGRLQYTLRGYEMNALRFILKPIERGKLMEALDKALWTMNTQKTNSFIIGTQDNLARYELDDILCIEAHSHFVEVKTKKDTRFFKEKIEVLEEKLPTPHFYRCHRSFLVNTSHVFLISHGELELDNGEKIPVAKRRWEKLNQAFLAFHTLNFK